MIKPGDIFRFTQKNQTWLYLNDETMKEGDLIEVVERTNNGNWLVNTRAGSETWPLEDIMLDEPDFLTQVKKSTTPEISINNAIPVSLKND